MPPVEHSAEFAGGVVAIAAAAAATAIPSEPGSSLMPPAFTHTSNTPLSPPLIGYHIPPSLLQ